MASIWVPNGVKVEMIYLLNVTRMENVYWVTNGGPATSGNLTSLWTLFRDWEQNTARAQRPTAVSLQLITITAMDSAGAPFYEAAVSPAIAGSLGQVSLPAVMSLACKHTTGLTGRSYRGRTYWIGLTRDDQENPDNIKATRRDGIQAALNTLRTNLATAGWAFSVASLYSGVDSNGRAVPRAAGVLTPVTATTVELGYDTQRHRKAPPVV